MRILQRPYRAMVPLMRLHGKSMWSDNCSAPIMHKSQSSLTKCQAEWHTTASP